MGPVAEGQFQAVAPNAIMTARPSRRPSGSRRGTRLAEQPAAGEIGLPDMVGELGRDIDASADAADLNALMALDVRCDLLLPTLRGSSAAHVWYFRGNVQAALQDIAGSNIWEWRQPHRERQILYLRRALSHGGSADLHPLVLAQISVNLANALNSFGRTFEAIALFDQALAHQPGFAMALGNRGLAKLGLARQLHDGGHRDVVAASAHADMTAALSDDAVWDANYPGAIDAFIGSVREISEHIDVEAVRQANDLDGWPLGRTSMERAYRRWALGKRLFINPLNDLGPHPIAAADALSLPDHHADVDAPPHFIAWFNQMKTEYATARLLLFESECWPDPHFADRELRLADTLDYPAYGVALEKMRLSFRSAYSILDKVAGFLNAYLELGDAPRKVNLRSVWGKEWTLRQRFEKQPNLALRGLFWLSHDIVGPDPGDQDAIAPDAADLAKLRNVLEHRCLVLREIATDYPSGVVDVTTVEEFSSAALRMLRLARTALMHLPFAVGAEERSREARRSNPAFPIQLPIYRRPIPG